MTIIIKFPIIKQKYVLIPLLYVNESKTFSASLEVSTRRIIRGLLIIPSHLITVSSKIVQDGTCDWEEPVLNGILFLKSFYFDKFFICYSLHILDHVRRALIV